MLQLTQPNTSILRTFVLPEVWASLPPHLHTRGTQFCHLSLYALAYGGNTIKGRQARSATLNAYLKAAAEFITAAGLPNPRFTTTMQHTMPDEYLPRIGKVLAEQKHGEFMPDQKDPVTPAMVRGYRANPPQRAVHRP